MNELPVGRRVAQWRVRRNMTQQQFADRIGRSKSWVDKVERGVRRLERVSSLREVADALRIDLGVLLADQPGRPDPAAAGVEGVRTALSRYHVEPSAGPVDVAELRTRLDHAEQTYRHARYPQLLALLPGLLDAARLARAARPDRTTAGLLVSGYALTTLALVKVDQGSWPGWLPTGGWRSPRLRATLRSPPSPRCPWRRPCASLAGNARRWRRLSSPYTG